MLVFVFLVLLALTLFVKYMMFTNPEAAREKEILGGVIVIDALLTISTVFVGCCL